MMIFRRHRKKIEELDERVASAKKEAAISQERLARVRRDIVAPLEARKSHNQFSDLIRASLRPQNSQNGQLKHGPQTF